MRRTNRIILICVETTKEAKTDSIYIDKTLKYVYNIDNETKIEYEYLTSKTNLLAFLTNSLLRNNQNKPAK